MLLQSDVCVEECGWDSDGSWSKDDRGRAAYKQSSAAPHTERSEPKAAAQAIKAISKSGRLKLPVERRNEIDEITAMTTVDA